MSEFTKSSAQFSPCKLYRYTLERWWSPFAVGKYVNFVMLNPSTADATRLDPTVNRCVGFAQRWGYGGLIVTNIFALRSTDPKRLKKVDDPIGPDNDEAIVTAASRAALVICAWGNWGRLPTHGPYLSRSREVIERLSDIELFCLGQTKAGFPKHPLYVRADKEIEGFV